MAETLSTQIKLNFSLPANIVVGGIDPKTSTLVCNGKPKTTVVKNADGQTYDLVISYNFTPVYQGPLSSVEVNAGESLFITSLGDIYNNIEDTKVLVRKDESGLAVIDSRAITTTALKVEHGS